MYFSTTWTALQDVTLHVNSKYGISTEDLQLQSSLLWNQEVRVHPRSKVDNIASSVSDRYRVGFSLNRFGFFLSKLGWGLIFAFTLWTVVTLHTLTTPTEDSHDSNTTTIAVGGFESLTIGRTQS